MSVLFLLLFTFSAFALPCEPYEIYIREQWIDAYTKLDATKISEHPRDATEKMKIQENLALLPP
jgi:hypothetical protein